MLPTMLLTRSCNKIKQMKKNCESCRMDSRQFFSSFSCKPKSRKPLEGYIRRLSHQYEPYKRKIFRKISAPSLMYVQPVAQTKYENSFKSCEDSSKESFIIESKKNCSLTQIYLPRGRFSYLLPISLSRIIIIVVIIGTIIALIFCT